MVAASQEWKGGTRGRADTALIPKFPTVLSRVPQNSQISTVLMRRVGMGRAIQKIQVMGGSRGACEKLLPKAMPDP